MIIEDEDETHKALANDKMRKIYDSIKNFLRFIINLIIFYKELLI